MTNPYYPGPSVRQQRMQALIHVNRRKPRAWRSVFTRWKAGAYPFQKPTSWLVVVARHSAVVAMFQSVAAN